MKVVRNIVHAAILAAVAATLLFAACSNSSDGSIPAPVPVLPQTPAPNEPVDPALTIPLTLEAAVAGATVTFDNKAAGSVTYKVNGGEAQTIASGASKAITLENVGDKVEFFGDNKTYHGSGNSNIACSEDCYIYGNIMSLVKSEGFERAVTLEKNYTFACLFKNNAHIKNKEGAILLLPATTLADHCYFEMFYGSSLTVAPQLPATTLPDSCYDSMFYDCANLTTAPSVLPATTLTFSCYGFMFQNCVNLISAPTISATTLADHCCYRMFAGCSNLTAAPDLPATNLERSCYSSMFYNCKKLTTAPKLPAPVLFEQCYAFMFEGCSNLSSVTCLATDISASLCTDYWLNGVAHSGTFTKAAGMTSWNIHSPDGIPSGWTIEDYQPSQQ